MVHGLDIHWPLRLTRDVPRERLQKSLTFVSCTPASGIVAKGTLNGLRFEANDIDWAHGSGPTVSGNAEALLLAITGRSTAFGLLSGDGVSQGVDAARPSVVTHSLLLCYTTSFRGAASDMLAA